MNKNLIQTTVNVILGIIAGGVTLLIGTTFGEASAIAFVCYAIIATKNI